ncbi:hypothetical protein G7062_10005 [Erysipelothrix sp. HDW6C]|uniref:hypothetical protein n=1 Tax=Erysipelothrix sp. HDW6C TaxID=2714930 RepID=UPI00140E9287|nr:hypothetical protein [Erysipelothrix sp. HDW6C]QIK70615.1 hypothetical protein G7062_10005 [Erysipelothrix sp. HDW6C]
MKRDKIMIVGGHGHVGRHISNALRGEKIILVGRNEARIHDFLNQQRLEAEVRVMDINQPLDEALLEDVAHMIVCIDQEDTQLIEYCDNHGLNYMDVTANSTYIERVAQLPLSQKGTYIFGVGLAPGLTNLLTHHFIGMYPEVKDIDVHIILGLGDKHGDAAITWTIDNLVTEYQWQDQRLTPFKEGGRVVIANSKYKSYNFNFADQFMLQREFADKNIKTKLGFDMGFATWVVHALSTTGLIRIATTTWMRNLIQGAMKRPVVGSDLFAVSIQGGHHEISVVGSDEAQFTGDVATLIARRMVSAPLKRGLITIADVIDVESLLELTQLNMNILDTQ